MSADLAFRLTGFIGAGIKSSSGSAPTDAEGSSSFGGLLDTMARATTAAAKPGASAAQTSAHAARQNAIAKSPTQRHSAGVTIPGPVAMSGRPVSRSTTVAGTDAAGQPEAADVASDDDASTTAVSTGTVDVAALAQAVLLAGPAAVLSPLSPTIGASAVTPPVAATSQTAPGLSPTLGTPATPADAATPTDIATAPAAAAAASTELAATPATVASAAGSLADEPPAVSPDPVSLSAPALTRRVATPIVAAPASQATPAVPSAAPGIADQVASGVVAAATGAEPATPNTAAPPALSVPPKAASLRPSGAKPTAPLQQSAGSSTVPIAVAQGLLAAGIGNSAADAESGDPGTSDQSEAGPDLAAQQISDAATSMATIAATDLTVLGQLGSASLQVAAALSSLAGAADGSAAVDSSAASAASGPMDQPGTARTLPDGGREVVVKLDPEHLGSVSIRLKMTGSKVDVSITVSDAHTLDVLNRDRHVLSAAVASAGLSGDGLTLDHGAADAGSTSNGSSTPNGQQGTMPDGRGSASASGDPSGGHRRRDPRPSSSAPRAEAAEAGLPVPDAPRTGALYV